MAGIVPYTLKSSANVLISELPAADGLAAASCKEELEATLSRRVFEPAAAIGEFLPFVAFTSCPPERSLLRRTHGHWFIVSDYRSDVGFEQDRCIAIPQGELSRLRRLNSAGVTCDHLWIAHELPKEWNPENPVPRIVPDPPYVRELDEAVESSVRTMLHIATRAASAIAKTTISLGAAAAKVGNAIALDPVIVGGIAHPKQPLVAWVLLAQWDW